MHQWRNNLGALLIALLILIFLNQCTQQNPYNDVNSPPHIPNVLFPTTDSTNIDVLIDLRWEGSDPNPGDIVTYDVFLEAGVPSPRLIVADLTQPFYRPDSLKFSTTYYWQVIATDNHGESTVSPLWSFTTRSEQNTPPNMPTYSTPEDGSLFVPINDVVLTWTGGDPDTFQTVTYRILLDTQNPPAQTLLVDYKETSLHLPLLNFDTRYYWQIIARDMYGAETAGPVWNFLTKGTSILLQDHFDGYPIGIYSPPDSLWRYGGQASDIRIVNNVFYGSAGNCCKFIDNSDESSNYLAATLKFPKSVGVFEFVWRVETSEDFFGVRMYSGTPDDAHLGPSVSIRGDSLQYYDHTQNWQYICDISPATWYLIRLVFDCDLGVFSIYVNDELMIPDATWRGRNLDMIRYIYFLTFNNRRCQGGYLDDVFFYSDPM
ncbi:fibronectin type III domain-containing protein [candidate division KSB1 bacterium]|nr:fibronectin type III domain-containing protein [candidate division KSB1 bacterium]